MRWFFHINEPIRSLLLIALMVLGLLTNALPDANGAITDRIDEAPEAQDSHSLAAYDHGQSAPDHPEIGGHCHPGLNCSLSGVMNGQQGVSFARRAALVSLIHPGHHLAPFIQVYDPPPPRGPVLL